MLLHTLKDDGFLFSDGNGDCWTMDIQTKTLIDFSTRLTEFRMTTQILCHVVKAIDREIIRGPLIEDSNDEADEIVDEQTAAHDLMQGLRSILPHSMGRRMGTPRSDWSRSDPEPNPRVF